MDKQLNAKSETVASERNAEKALKQLKEMGASKNLLAKFTSLVRINLRFEEKSRASIEQLLLDACRDENFTKPFEGDGRKRTFRARLLPETHPDYRDDIGGSFIFESKNSPGEEQAYRRGYDQGFSYVLDKLRNGTKLQSVEKEAHEVHAWRTTPIQIIGTLPGGKEPYTLGMSFRRSGISLSLRYKVFQRDNFKCKYCGTSASDGATLEVDHVIPFSRGGTNEIDNLQVLCFECNRGKSDIHQ